MHTAVKLNEVSPNLKEIFNQVKDCYCVCPCLCKCLCHCLCHLNSNYTNFRRLWQSLTMRSLWSSTCPGPQKWSGPIKTAHVSSDQNSIYLVDPCQTNNAVFALCKRFDISHHGADHSLIMKLMNPLIWLTLFNCDIKIWYFLFMFHQVMSQRPNVKSRYFDNWRLSNLQTFHNISITL